MSNRKRSLLPFLRPSKKSVNVAGAFNPGASAILSPTTSGGTPLNQQSPTNSGATNAPLTQSLTMHQALPVPTFDGSPSSSVEEWLVTYETIGSANGWLPDELKRRLPAYLKASGLTWWLTNKDTITQNSWGDVRDALKTAFGASRPEITRFDEMIACRQKTLIGGHPCEDVQTYFFRKIRLLNAVDSNMAPATQVLHILNGFAPKLRARLLTVKKIDTPSELFNKSKQIYETMVNSEAHLAADTRRHEVNAIMAGDQSQRQAEQRVLDAMASGRYASGPNPQAFSNSQRPANFPTANPTRPRLERDQCSWCLNRGHWAAACASKQNGQPRKRLSEQQKNDN